MNETRKKFVIGVVVLFVVLFIVSNIYTNFKSEETGEVVSEVEAVVQEPTPPPAPSVRYFAQGSDSVTISAAEKTLSLDNPTTTLTYSAGGAHFSGGDRAFVRILGISVEEPYTQNAEIYHPVSADGSTDNSVFSGDITIDEPGKFLIKVCLGPSINLDANGKMIWPFGCWEDSTSEVVDVTK